MGKWLRFLVTKGSKRCCSWWLASSPSGDTASKPWENPRFYQPPLPWYRFWPANLATLSRIGQMHKKFITTLVVIHETMWTFQELIWHIWFFFELRTSQILPEEWFVISGDFNWFMTWRARHDGLISGRFGITLRNRDPSYLPIVYNICV